MHRNEGEGEGEGVWDAAVVGASFAGLSAALYLARARPRVLLLDVGGETRNRFAAHAHGFLGQDGRAPAEIRAAGLRDVLAYPTVSFREARVTGVDGADGAFRVTDAAGETVRARKVILAHGMRDLLPDISGLEAAWGVTAIQCPYCHGYELADRPTGVLMTAPGVPHHALMLRDWTADIIVLAHGQPVTEAERDLLAGRGVRFVEGRVTGVRHREGHIEAVEVEGGTEVALGALYLVTRSVPAAPLPAALGLAMTEGPTGGFIQVDDLRRTSVPGVFAAGDLVRPMYGSAFAAADGVMAGTACHRDLLGL